LCHAPLPADSPRAAVHVCAGCATAYHASCAAELGGCSVLGCPERGVQTFPAEPEAPEPTPSGRAYRACVLLSLVVVAICFVTELLNHRAGDFFSSTKADSTWRIDEEEFEHVWLKHHGLLSFEWDGHSRVRKRELTESERAQLKRDMRAAKARNDLLRWTQAVCCIQYTLLPLTCLGLVAQLGRGRLTPRQRRVAIALLVLVGICGVLTLYRDYARAIAV